ncbi:MAG: tetratricopeptide repeat protein [Pirellulaceae bacterium]
MIRKLSFAALLLAFAAPVFAADSKPVPPAEKPVATDKVLDGFLAAVKENKEFKAEQVQKATEIFSALRADADGKSIAITEALRELYPDFKDALTTLGEENIQDAITKLGKLRDAKDPYLAADAAYFLARALLLDERFEDALPLLEDATGKYADKTARGGESLFLRGVAFGQLIQRKEAMDCLKKFLELYPDAPERMRVGAFRQLEALKLYEDGTLTDVQFRMEFSRRKLSLEDAGQATREQQKKIIDILAKLIKEAEDKECNCKGGGKPKPGSKPGKGSEGESQAKGEGQGQQGTSGGGSKGTDSDTVKRLHRGGPTSPWSQLRDRERDPVFNAIKEKYPARYQQLIEQYYKSFSDESDG